VTGGPQSQRRPSVPPPPRSDAAYSNVISVTHGHAGLGWVGVRSVHVIWSERAWSHARLYAQSVRVAGWQLQVS
jgi:hypothetical protein